MIIPAAYSLDRVHAVIQAAMGWQNCHLHAFRAADVSYGPPDPHNELGHLDERKFRLGELTAERIFYEYDFGDRWEHELIVEERTTAVDGAIYPICVAGESACPPEDCGGSYGFADSRHSSRDRPARSGRTCWSGRVASMTRPASHTRPASSGVGSHLPSRSHSTSLDDPAGIGHR